MSLTQAQARDDILAVLKAVWDATGYTMNWPNVAFEIPETATPWGRATLNMNITGGQTLGNHNGQKRYTRQGLLTVQIFVPTGEGLSLSDNSVKIIQDGFEGKTSANGVWFRNIRVNDDIGQDGNWYPVNVLIDFEYDEIK